MAAEVSKIKTDSYNNDERVIVPPADIYETDTEYVVSADMPGVTRDTLDITLDKGQISINGKAAKDESAGELKYGEYAPYNFSRTFSIGSEVNGEAITASLSDGVVVITLPKKEEVKPKKIEVTIN